jgi:phosphate transport system substrate-binding protein
MKSSFRSLLTASLMLTVAAAFAGTTPLIWRGDTTTAHGFVDGMAKAWHKDGHPAVTLQPFNTVSGIDAVAKGRADIAGSVRGRAPRRAAESKLVFTPVAWDGLVIVANAHNPVKGLTLRQLHDIYYGKITNWSQVGGKDQPIHVYAVASPTDGIEFSLRHLLFGRGNQPVAAPRLYLSVKSLQQAVALDPQAMGVSTLSNAHDKSKLKMLAIDGVAPSVTNVADGSYPLYTPLYLVTRPTTGNAQAPKAEKIQQFLAFARSPQVAAVMHEHALVPYADAQALAGHKAERMAAIARETGRRVVASRNGRITAPGATYAAGAANAPTSQRTAAARQQMLAKRGEDRAARVRANATQQARRSLAQGQSPSGGGTGMASNVTWYTVESGDTLSRIAQKKSVTVEQLKDWNDLQSNLIRVGQKLAIHQD